MPNKKNEKTQSAPLPGEEGAPQEIEKDQAPAEPTPSLEDELAASREESRKNWDQFLRTKADLENYRKRAQREKEDLARFANENILREILPVVDNLERAMAHAAQEEGGTEGLIQGVEMTLSQFQKVLEKFGVSPVSAVGEVFDPARHEAMGQVESSEVAPNTVAQELQRGYLLNDRLLRPALVLVAKAPAQPSNPS
ncbi:MAG TPA: nucleotide exchange factor GrpE [Desulfuromonadales bacterium]|nr:nucleotide exchange factor GrpE [Desulfuromonadales bacterium]